MTAFSPPFGEIFGYTGLMDRRCYPQKRRLKQFIGGGERDYSFLTGDFVRDKDSVSACALFK